MTDELTIYKNKNKAIVPYVKKKKLKKINNETLLILSLVYVYLLTCRYIFIKKNLKGVKIIVKRIRVGTAVAAPVSWGMFSVELNEYHTNAAIKHNSDFWWSVAGRQGNWEFEDRVQGINWEIFVRDLWHDNLVHFTKSSINSEIYTKERKVLALMGHGYDGPFIKWPKQDPLIPALKRADWGSWYTLEEALKLHRHRLALKELSPDFDDGILARVSVQIHLEEYKKWLTKAYTDLQPDELSIAMRELALSKLQEATFLETVPTLNVAEVMWKACADPVLLTLLGGAAVAAGALWGAGPGLSKDSWEAGLKTLVKFIGDHNKSCFYMWPVIRETKEACKNPDDFGLKMLIKVLGDKSKLLSYLCPKIKEIKVPGHKEKHWEYTLMKLWSSADANYLKILKFQENTYEDFKMLKELKRLMCRNRIEAYSILAKPIKFKSLSYYKDKGNLAAVKYVINWAKAASHILNESKLENTRDYKKTFATLDKKTFATVLGAVLKVLRNLLNK